jgi:hypothetical protein
VDVPITSQGSPRSTVWQPAAATAVHRGVGAGIVVHVKAVWATTVLGAISRADHVAITGGFRSATIDDGVTADFRKHSERTESRP